MEQVCANAEGGGGENRCKSSISLYSLVFILSSVKMILFTLGLLIKNLVSGNILCQFHTLSGTRLFAWAMVPRPQNPSFLTNILLGSSVSSHCLLLVRSAPCSPPRAVPSAHCTHRAKLQCQFLSKVCLTAHRFGYVTSWHISVKLFGSSLHMNCSSLAAKISRSKLSITRQFPQGRAKGPGWEIIWSCNNLEGLIKKKKQDFPNYVVRSSITVFLCTI